MGYHAIRMMPRGGRGPQGPWKRFKRAIWFFFHIPPHYMTNVPHFFPSNWMDKLCHVTKLL